MLFAPPILWPAALRQQPLNVDVLYALARANEELKRLETAVGLLAQAAKLDPARADVQKLLDVLNRLVESGNTVLVIEHNVDVIRNADWLIDLGPEGGDRGGHVMAAGTPKELTAVKVSHTAQVLREAAM